MSDEAAFDRTRVRAFVASHGGKLELAQAQGVLARTKLDLKDDAEAAFPGVVEADRLRFERILEEEVEAFCADRRLATVTIQAQIERTTRMNIALALFLALLAGAVTAFFGVPIVYAIVGGGSTGGGAGAFVLVIVAPLVAILSFFWLRQERTSASPA